MRRPLIIMLIVIIGISFFYIDNKSTSTSYDQDIVTIKGVAKQVIKKEKYYEYKIDDFLVRDNNKNRNIKVGDILIVEGIFNNLDNMEYDDFNYGRYIKSIGYKGIVYIKSYKIVGKNTLYSKLGEIKSYIRNTSRYLYKKNSDFLNSVIIGERENLSLEEKDMFSVTGTSHVIAISGLHTGIFCGMIAFLMRKIDSIYKLVILFIIIWLYSLMVGSPPSIIRSIAFITTLYLSVFLDRKQDSISILALVGILLVINNPYIIYNVSFQLSFLATLSIIYFYGYINHYIKIKLISLTLSANILTLPIIYYNFKGIPILSVIGNMIIVPFIGVIMYIGIISLILFNINIWISKVLADINILLINSIYFLLEMLTHLDFAYINVKNPNICYVIIYYIAVFLYMFYKELKVVKEQENELQGYY